jgi:hypothetical protein
MIPQKFFSIKFLLLLEFAAYKKNLLFHSVTVQYISTVKNKEKREKQRKKSFKKTFIGFCCRKQNKGKSDQINSELSKR